MKHLPKKVLVSSLALAMMLGAGTSAFAKDNDRNDDRKESHSNNGKNGNNGWHGQKIQFNYRDIQSKDMEWALRYIADLASRRIFEGYSDGSFRPQNTVTRIEAITAAVRLMGLRDQAESTTEMQTQLNFKDANQVPSWAVGYVSIALKNDLFGESETMVNPNTPADRLWATTLLVKALKLQNEAEAQMNAKLTFADSSKIPAGAVGYVAVATQKGLINGFEDNTFRPNQPVTRAQIAALLDRAGDQLGNSSDFLITGTVTGPVVNNTLTVSQGGQTISYALDPDVFVFRGGARVSPTALQTGDVVKLRTYNNEVLYAEVTSYNGTPTYPTNPTPTLPSTVNTGVLISPVTSSTLAISSNGQSLSLPLASNALIYRNGGQINASALQVGDVISTRAYNNAIVYVEVTQPAGTTGTQPTFSRQVTGTLTTPISGGAMTLTSGGQLVSLSLNSNAFIYRGGVQVSASSLQVGDVMTVYAYNNTVAVAEVTQMATTPTTATGDITGTVASLANGNTVVINNGSQNVSLTLNPNAFIYRGGVQTGAAALQVGDVVTLHYYNNAVLYGEVTQLAGGGGSPLPAITQTSGSFLSTTNSNTLSILSGNQVQTLTLNANAFVFRYGAQSNLASLQPGDVLNIRSYNGSVIFIEVTSTNTNQNGTVSGTISSLALNNQGKIATINLNQVISGGGTQLASYSVSSSVTIYGDVSKLVANQQVVLTLSGSTVTTIYIP
ncbi:S-layer homology domain-containing protein [Paenibacillus cremeus]|uniref:S-layer homology domain-containing protein n=1 Tax=Paenibacillus cremeus TaxID=2163881 RepID=A0A559KFH7_9BACL|nr:S-layer homology domain-containing protein [Paenibacillus cremeus]TVY10876.1 S-layer homology domain-containing protein [Paenibacillus cremeus]